MRISTEIQGQHQDFDSVSELSDWLEQENLLWVNSATTCTINEVADAILANRDYIVLPVDDCYDSDLTINFTYDS